MHVFCKYYSDLTLRACRFVAKVFQFKATVWPKVASELTYEAQKFQNFLGEHPPDSLSCFCIPYCKQLKAGRGLGTRLLANVVCPRCALVSAVFWLRHCSYASQFLHTRRIISAMFSSYCVATTHTTTHSPSHQHALHTQHYPTHCLPKPSSAHI